MATLLFYGDPAEAVRVMWPGGREQQVTPFATAHGHVGVIGTDGQTDLASVAAHSKLILDLVRSAGPLPAYEHELRDLRILVQAVRAYADANNGVLPSTLGPTIPYIPAEDCPTPAEVARAYLSPVAERAVAIPGEPTPDWVNQNASYRYLGGPGLILRKVTPRALIILHGDPEEPFDRVWFGGVGKVIPSAGLRGDPLAGDIHGYNPDQFRDTAAQTRSFLTSAQEPAALPEAMQVSVRLRQVGRLVIAYAQKHDGRFPADLGATLEYADDTDEHGKPLTPAERARVFLAPRDEKSVQIPEKPTRDWVNRHTSFVYYGNDAVNWNEAPRWGQTAVVSADLDREGFATEPGRPATLYPVCMIDNHVDLLPKPAAAWYASTSKETYAAIRDGAPFPDRDQAAWDLSQISAAMNRYSNKHDGHLPPDLGSLLRYVETRGPRLAKPADRARVFLSPKAERGMRVPDRPTPEWVNAHATYVYLGSADILRARIADARSTVVLHIGADEPQSVVGGDGRAGDTFPVATLEGPAPLVYGLERLRPALEQSKAILAAARGAGPLPDYYHALRDVRLITVAARAYAADHSDELPPDLGSMLDYIPANALMDPRDAERAKVFLSPKDEATSTVPARPTREWINQHASYIYLGGPGILLSRINQGPCIIVHASLKEPYQVSDLLGDFSRVPAGDIFPGASALGFGAGGDFDRVLLESRRVLDAAKKPR